MPRKVTPEEAAAAVAVLPRGDMRVTPVEPEQTADPTEDILERIEKHAVGRFSSTYMVGFVPPPSGAPREHKLEVKLAPKSGGKVSEGKRIATY